MAGNTPFVRQDLIERAIGQSEPWDVIVIGGGATGLGTAVDAASRGYSTLLLEASDFGQGTSSRSTKLVHGGVRYLRQGNVSMVIKSLRERGRMLRNASHVVHPREFIVPCYQPGDKLFYGAGLKLYDVLAGKRGIGRSVLLSREEVIAANPSVRTDGLRGGVLYLDGQFDDARYAVNLAKTCVEQGGVVLNYMRVSGLLKSGGRVDGVVARDVHSDAEYSFRARSVVNATGVFADSLRQIDDEAAPSMIRPSQGIHLVLDRSFMDSDVAIMVPKTDDGRVLFGIPWYGRVLLGTTDTAVDTIRAEPRPFEEEIDYLIEHAGRYLRTQPSRRHVRSVFTGLRPLVSKDDHDTKSISRDHVIRVSRSGLVTITGGKWTTYREMAADAVDHAAEVGGLPAAECVTKSLRIHGWTEARGDGRMSIYGSDRPAIERLTSEIRGGNRKIHARLPYTQAEVVWAVRHEMACTVEDVLARRTRSLFLDATACRDIAGGIASIVAEERGMDRDWARRQEKSFLETLANYEVAPVGGDGHDLPQIGGRPTRLRPEKAVASSTEGQLSEK
ncbi:MAG: glycerol-3-phosphate dehydrogenase/oxidase [Rhodothermales bacterium]|nr:glycerol-3-phosphate dehydrogenase/oxidase [Rhodothermales bacterium]